MPPHPLNKFEIQKYYQNRRKFNGVYSRNNLRKIKNWTQLINLDGYKSIGTLCMWMVIVQHTLIALDFNIL